MTEKTLLHALDPYFTTRTGSQGLGLTTALSSLQRMGGTMLLESTEIGGHDGLHLSARGPGRGLVHFTRKATRQHDAASAPNRKTSHPAHG